MSVSMNGRSGSKIDARVKGRGFSINERSAYLLTESWLPDISPVLINKSRKESRVINDSPRCRSDRFPPGFLCVRSQPITQSRAPGRQAEDRDHIGNRRWKKSSRSTIHSIAFAPGRISIKRIGPLSNRNLRLHCFALDRRQARPSLRSPKIGENRLTGARLDRR